MKTETNHSLIIKSGLMRWIKYAMKTLFVLLIINISTSAQGFINNGATISVNINTIVIVEGTAGHFTNQDDGISNGWLENSGTLSISGNWINNSGQYTLNANTGTVTLEGANQSIGGITPTWFNNLTLNGSGIKTLLAPQLIGGGYAFPSGVLNLNNLPLDLNQFTLTVNNPLPSAISRTSGYIVSETNSATNPSILIWNMMANTGSYVYPFGVNGAYIPLTITKNSTATGLIAASTRTTVINDNLPFASGVSNMYSATIGGSGAIPVVIDRWWNITSTGPVVVDLAFTYRGLENTTTFTPTGTFGAQKWIGSWQPPVGSGAGVTSGTSVVTATAQLINALNGDWVLSNTAAPLPIELVSFEAACKGNEGVLISWRTASEQNVDHFEIEKSEDGIHYFPLGSLSAVGNSNTIQNYELNAVSISATTYYRLKEIDQDGVETSFNPVSVERCNSSAAEPSLFSDGSEIKINMYSDDSSPCHVVFYDLAGRLISDKIYTLQEGLNQVTIFEGTMVTGIYMAKIEQGTRLYGKKIMIK